MFKSEKWSEFFASIPEVLQPTASLVKSTVLASRADGTVPSYLGSFKRWKCWASSNHVCHFPPNPFQVAVYLQCLLNEAYSPSPVLNAVYSIDWALQLAGLSKISIHPLVASMVSASQRILGRLKVKKDPMTPEMLTALVESKITDKSPSLSDFRSVALCLIGYAGFFRFSELRHIKACDVKFFPSYVSIFLESSKCYQFRDGAWIIMARTDLPTCPVKAWRTTSRRLKSISSGIYRCLESLPLLKQKKKYEAKGLAIQELKNSLRTALEIQRMFPRLVFIALGREEPPLRLMPVSLIDFSSDMAVGRARTPRMATLRTILILACQSRSL